MLINRYFNIRSYIAIIHGTNINLLEFSSTRIARSGNIPLSYTTYMVWNTQNATGCIKLKTIEIWFGVVQPTSRQTFHDLKLQKINIICISSNILTTKVITKWTATTIHSGNTNLTIISTIRSFRSSEKSELIQFA